MQAVALISTSYLFCILRIHHMDVAYFVYPLLDLYATMTLGCVNNDAVNIHI